MSRASFARVWRFSSATCAVLIGAAAGAHGQIQFPTPPIIIDVPSPPTPFVRDGRINLVYEIHVTNMGQLTLLIDRAEILRPGPDSIVAQIAGGELAETVMRPVPALKLVDPTMVEAGRRALILVWAQLAPGATAPATLRHRITMKALPGAPAGPTWASSSVTSSPVAVLPGPAPVLGAPLRGGRWVARFGGNPDAHRRALATFSGTPRILQRFAIDFGLLGEDGRQFKPDASSNEGMYGHNAEVLAVADARVVSVVDGIPENDPTKPLPAPTTFAGGMGNNIVLDLGNGFFAGYSHLRPGMMQVKAGDKVRKGQLIARVGNTGSSTGPHLHFQVFSSADYTKADGRPYVFDHFSVIGTEALPQFQSLQWTPDPSVKPVKYLREMPPNRAVIVFDR